jgi:hypothetical protein
MRKENSTRPAPVGVITKTGILVGKDQVCVDPEEVTRLAAMWCTYKEMAEWFGIHADTLKFNFETEIAQGRSRTKQALRRKQIDMALAGDKTMLIWLGKNILQQSDNPTEAQQSQPLPWSDDVEVGNKDE